MFSKGPMTTDEPDSALIEMTRDGDDNAYCELVRRYQARLRGFAARYLNDPHDVDDIVQEAFVDAYNNLDRFRIESDFWPWLRTICKNRTLNFLRSRKVRRNINLRIVDEALEFYLAEDDSPDENNIERIQALRECIGTLKESQQELIRDRYYDRANVKDLAAAMSQSAAGLSMKLYRIRSILKKCVQRRLQTNT
jgi:RNA polymerase sigma-70 factor (ECF subfamily)